MAKDSQTQIDMMRAQAEKGTDLTSIFASVDREKLVKEGHEELAEKIEQVLTLSDAICGAIGIIRS